MQFERITSIPWQNTIDLAEIVRAFSYALDLTEGQPAGHCVRACWIGCHIGRAIGLAPDDLVDLYYTLLLKDLGCSSNAARICELYEADDLAFKRGFKTVGTSLAASLLFVLRKSAKAQPLHRRAARIGNILKDGAAIVDEMILSRCTRGADIASTLQFSRAVQLGIYCLDEHWDGSGRPGHVSGQDIPLFARIALIAQVAEVFHGHAGREAAIAEVQRRSGTWFDPELVDAFSAVAHDEQFWDQLRCPFLDSRLPALIPTGKRRVVDEDYLDEIAAAFGQVIDAKSPFTANHSSRVGDISTRIAEYMGVPQARRRRLRRAALLHDIGKLGVSNAILDKPGPLDEREWESMRSHAAHTLQILRRIQPLQDIAAIAAAHHERLDGCGYPLGLTDTEIQRETRIITVADFYDALTADRPYRGAMPRDSALAIMARSVGSGIDSDCFEALRNVDAPDPT